MKPQNIDADELIQVLGLEPYDHKVVENPNRSVSIRLKDDYGSLAFWQLDALGTYCREKKTGYWINFFKRNGKHTLEVFVHDNYRPE